MSDYYISQVRPSDHYAQQQIDRLLQAEGIRRDANLDYTCAMYDEDMNIIATGSCFGNTLRCMAVSSSHQGEGLMNEIVTHLVGREFECGHNCNVVVGSDGIITGAQGGHPDTAQGAKCTIVICPLLQGRIPAICSEVTTVTTPGESVDIVVTDYGVAVNPNRPDLLKALEEADCVPLKTIEQLRDEAYAITGVPNPVEFGDRIVGIIEARDGTIMDVVREIKD